MLTDEQRARLFAYFKNCIADESPFAGSTATAMVDHVADLLTQARSEERKRCAAYCGLLAEMMEQGAGELTPGGRLRQAEQTILADNHTIRARKDEQ